MESTCPTAPDPIPGSGALGQVSLKSADVEPLPPDAVLFREDYAKSVRLAHLLTGSNSVAEDLVHEAFARLHRHRGPIDNPGGYLRCTVVNVCRSWHRSRAREHAHLVRHGLPTAVLSNDALELLDVLRRLSYRQRSVIVLRYWLNLSEAEIAETLGCRPGTVKSLHTRAIEHLRKEIPT